MRLTLITILLASFTIGGPAEDRLNKDAPDLTLEYLNGKKILLTELLENGPVLVDFWATWCEPCKKEMVYLDKFHRQYGDSGFQVLAINQDSPRSLSKVRAYIRAKRFTFPVFVDPNKQIAQKLNVQVLPTTLLISAEGKIVWRHVGFLPGDERDIEKVIREAISQQEN